MNYEQKQRLISKALKLIENVQFQIDDLKDLIHPLIIDEMSKKNLPEEIVLLPENTFIPRHDLSYADQPPVKRKT
jgi:hypothetical protein